MRKQIKYILALLLFVALLGTSSVYAAEFEPSNPNIAETGNEDLIYVIGTHLFTENTPYISSQIMMYAARTIDVPEGVEGQDALEYMHVYSRDLEGNWIDAITGEPVTFEDGFKFDIKYKDLEKYIVTSADVTNVEEMEKALADADIKTINIMDDFETDHSIIITKPVTINGNDKTITYTEEAGTWEDNGDNYVLKVYDTEATINGLKLTGANAGMLVGSSDVTLKGTIDVSGNAFGGIEVSKGSALDRMPSLDATEATLVNTDEKVTLPTVWEDGVTDCVTLDLVKVTGVKEGQVFYFNEMPEVNVTNVEEMVHALATNLEVINVTEDFETDHSIIVLRAVTINGNDKTITYTGEAGEWVDNGDNYIIKVYNTEATIDGLKLTGANAGLLVQSSDVVLTGTIDVSGNVFGGIEVSKGSTLERMPSLDATETTFINSTEKYGQPTVWEDGVTDCVELSLEKVDGIKEGQNQYYMVSPIAEVNSVEAMEEALANNRKEIINVTENFETDHSIIVLRPVTINGNDKTITYTGEAGEWVDNGDNYIIKVYNTEAIIDGLKLTGANAGLLVQSSDVVLTGTIDVSGNVFGGIEVSKGSTLERMPSLDATETTFINSTEKYGQPTVWEDGVTDCVELSLEKEDGIKAGQSQYYIISPIAEVDSVEAMEEALANNRKEVINVTENFGTNHSIIVLRPVTINGNDKTITYTEEAGTWEDNGDNYVLKVYDTEATINGLKLTGANAGMLVGSSDVTLKGTIDVSGNAFGGIEVSKGSALDRMPSLDATEATLVNTDEKVTLPTVWEDGVTDCVTLDLVKVTGVKEGQVFYFNEMPEVNVTSVEEMEHALATNLEVINVTEDFETDHSILVLRPVTINGNDKTITYTGEAGEWVDNGDNYIIKVYNTEATINGLKLTGANAGLLVQSSDVVLTGTIDVSGNAFGGIEVSKGSELERMPSLDVTKTTLVNTDEAENLPTIWEDQIEGFVNDADTLRQEKNEEKNQMFYFVNQI